MVTFGVASGSLIVLSLNPADGDHRNDVWSCVTEEELLYAFNCTVLPTQTLVSLDTEVIAESYTVKKIDVESSQPKAVVSFNS